VLGSFGVGAPATAIYMERLITHGAEAVCIVGGCGGLGGNVVPHEPIVCDSAVRDEGVSHHYLPSETYVSANTALVSRLEDALDTTGFDYQTGPSWTTDAIFRETVPEIEHYSDEGVLAVEMEAAAVFAIAKYRDIDAAALLCPFDLVMTDRWEPKQGATVDGLRDLLIPTRDALLTHHS
jgi:uridine phosphorylase